MKRFLALLVCVNFILCGCGATQTETEPVISETEIVHTETAVSSQIASTEDSSTVPTEILNNASISETVVFNNGDFKLTAKEIDFSDDYDIKVKFLVENNTNKNISIIGQDFSINGITMYCSF